MQLFRLIKLTRSGSTPWTCSAAAGFSSGCMARVNRHIVFTPWPCVAVQDWTTNDPKVFQLAVNRPSDSGQHVL